MRPWKIVLISAAVAIAATIGVTRPELTLAPHSAAMPRLLPLLPTLAVAALAVYALCAILLSAGALIASSLRWRRQLERGGFAGEPAPPGRPTDFEAGEWASLPRSPRAGPFSLQNRFGPDELRKEATRMFYVWAARTHFFSALILLTAAVALGEAQQHASLPIMPGPIPTAAAVLAVAGLVLVALLARIAVDITIEPLTEGVGAFPAGPSESDLLHRTVNLLEAEIASRSVAEPGAPTLALEMPDRLISGIEQGQRALLEAVERLSTTTEKAAAGTRASIESLEATLRAGPNPLAAHGPPADLSGLSELKASVAALTAVLERVLNASAGAAQPDVAADPGPPRPTRDPGLAQELSKLLQDIGANP